MLTALFNVAAKRHVAQLDRAGNHQRQALPPAAIFRLAAPRLDSGKVRSGEKTQLRIFQVAHYTGPVQEPVKTFAGCFRNESAAVAGGQIA